VRRRRSAASRGLTILELVMSASILIALLGAVGAALNSSIGAWKSGSLAADLEKRADRTMERVVRVIGPAGATTFVPDPLGPLGASALTFRPAIGYASGAATFGNPMRLEWQADPRDASDGVDNNTNGVVDEGVLVLKYDYGLSSERSVVLARDVSRYLEGETANGADDNANGLVDEKGFSVVRSGRSLTIRLTLVKKERGGGLVYRTAEESIVLRN
jgi:hypothetical protein